jgi:biopolymer transport protein ExbB/TolQ
MEKNGKEAETCKHRSYFLMKVLLLVLCVLVVSQFALIAKCFASLKALNNKLKAVKEEKSLDFRSLKSETQKHGTRRSKRGTAETDLKKALIKLEKLEGR